ncbi:MAG: hypothetical protein Q9224_003577 [Gallowayella concinna]
MCWIDTHGSMQGELLTAHLAEDTNITVSSILSDFLSDSLARNGDIVLYEEKDKHDRLDTAVLFRTTFQVTTPSGDRFVRYITAPRAGFNEIGYMFVERPVPDPDTQFESLAQDKLLDGIPTSLRSAVDPSADVFYFSPDPTNTACLSGITSPPLSPTSPPVPMISSLEYRSNAPPATKVVDFADLPCPPSAVAKAYDPGVPYFPIIVPLLGVKFNLAIDRDGNWHSDFECAAAAVRDPPVRAIRVGKITGPKDGGDGIV